MAEASDPKEDRPGQVVAGRFRIRRRVASGGMANVYEAEDLNTGQVGALKLLRAHCRNQPDAIERLSREASVATRVSDPHIVQALDAGKLAGGEPYVFMELLRGESLDQLITRRGRLPIVEALDIAAQAARGLCAAHAAAVLHRDIKPANLFLADGPRRLVKLLDFGVSKLPDQMALTREGFTLGTFCYMPPEQMLSAKRVDGRADLYSLGVVLYRSIAGRLPFVAKSLHGLMSAMEKNDYVPVSRLRADVPPELDTLLGRTLRAEPKERYASAAELLDELTRLGRRSLAHRTLTVGATPPPAVSVPARQPERAAPKSRAPALSRPGFPLVETVVPKTRPRS
jgi:serine/threonine protein kinase